MEELIVAEREIEWLRGRMVEKNELLLRWEERWREVEFVPWDRKAEESVIGCVLVAPADLAGRAFKRLRKDKFYDPYHGWLWARLSWAHRTVVWEGGAVMRHLQNDGAREKASDFGGELCRDLLSMTSEVFYWNLDYFIGKIEVAAMHRNRIAVSKTNLDRLIREAREAEAKGYA